MASLKNGITFKIFKGSKAGEIVESTVRRDHLTRDEVLLRVTHSGLCGTDKIYLNEDMCLGHECAGIVQQVGPETKYLKVDDRVGFGYQHSSCGSCAQCLRGLETYCSRAVMYGFADLDTGSMASHAVFRESFTYKIPSALSNETACALMCGGATVFALLDMFNVKPTDRVGIVGVGGLGHLAIQFAAKWGCEVVAFSGTADKRDDAMALGAKEFIVTKGLDAIKIPTTIDHLLVTSSKQVRWGLYLPIMAPCSTIYPLCVDVEDIKIPCIQFLCKGLRLQASVVAPSVVHKRMLDFAAVHDIRPMVMRYKLSKQGIEQAIEDLEKGRMRYKGVLSASG